MAEPIVWSDLPMSQDNPMTIGEYIAAQMANHNADPDAHYDEGGAISIHRENSTIDHPMFSVKADNLEDDIPAIGTKAGVFPGIGEDWTQVAALPNVSYYRGAYGDVENDRFVLLGAGGATAYSTDGDTWTAGDTITGALWNRIAYGAGMFVAARDAAGSPPLYYSTDGDSWTAITSLGDMDCAGVVWNGTEFVAAIYDTALAPDRMHFAHSADGITWTYDEIADVSVNFTSFMQHPSGLYMASEPRGILCSWDLADWFYVYYIGDQIFGHLYGAGEMVMTDVSNTFEYYYPYNWPGYDENDIYIDPIDIDINILIEDTKAIFTLNGFSFAEMTGIVAQGMTTLANVGEVYIGGLYTEDVPSIALSANQQGWIMREIPTNGYCILALVGQGKLLVFGSNGTGDNAYFTTVNGV